MPLESLLAALDAAEKEVVAELQDVLGEIQGSAVVKAAGALLRAVLNHGTPPAPPPVEIEVTPPPPPSTP